jgi:hypothetical protein
MCQSFIAAIRKGWPLHPRAAGGTSTPASNTRFPGGSNILAPRYLRGYFEGHAPFV